MSLEIVGNTVNGKTSKGGWKQYSNFVEESLPAYNTSGTLNKWVLTAYSGHYGYLAWSSVENVYLQAVTQGGTSSTGGSRYATIATNVDLRKYKEFYFSGLHYRYEKYANTNSNTVMKLGIINNGTTTWLETKPDVDDVTDLHWYGGWSIRGKIVGDQLTLYYGGMSSSYATTTATINGKIQIAVKAETWSEYSNDGRQTINVTGAWVK